MERKIVERRGEMKRGGEDCGGSHHKPPIDRQTQIGKGSERRRVRI